MASLLASFAGSAIKQTADDNNPYKVDAREWVREYRTLLSEIDASSADLQLDNIEWRNQVLGELEALKALDQKVRGYKPPPLYVAWHFGLNDSVANPYDAFADKYGEGIETRNAELISQAQSDRNDIDRKLDQFSYAVGATK